MEKTKNLTKKELSERNDDLLLIKKTFKNLKLRFFLERGVFLGAVREKNFIIWDRDIKLSVFTEEVFSETKK